MTFLTEDQIQDLYAWIDEIPLSRPKRNIHRDFSDAVLAAEVLRHFYPKLIDIHNYQPANSTSQKVYNWRTLSQKALKRLGIPLSDDQMNALASGKPGSIEEVLLNIRGKINDALNRSGSGGGDQYSSNNSLRIATKQSRQSHHNQQLPSGFMGGIGAAGGPPFFPQQPHQQPHQQQGFMPQLGMGQFLPPISPSQPMMMQQPPSPAMQMYPQTQFMHPQQQQQMYQQQPPQQPQQYRQQRATAPQPAPPPPHQNQHHHQPRAKSSPRTQKISSSASKQKLHAITQDDNMKNIYETKLQEQGKKITELNETVDILQLKIQKLEQLLQLKDRKLEELTRAK